MTPVSVRSTLAAGVAAVGVGAVALAPVQPLHATAAFQPANAGELGIELAAAVDPISAIANTVDNTITSLTTLANNWANGIYVAGKFPPPSTGINAPNTTNKGYQTGEPLPILQQVLANWLGYFGELPDIAGIVGNIFGNVVAALEAPFQPGVMAGLFKDQNQNVSAAPIPGFGITPRGIYAPLLKFIPDLQPLLEFTSTPISGLLVGAVGPILAPVLSVIDSVGAAVSSLGNSDFLGALYDLINIPTNAINAFLNGGPNLDLTPLLGLPEGVKIGLQMGGLLSPGGVAFDALSAEVGTITSPGLPVGPIGALSGLTNYLATAITPAPAPQHGGDSVVEEAAAVRSARLSETTAALTEPATAPSAARAHQNAPAAAKHRPARRAAAVESASGSADSDPAPKASAARRSVR